MHLAPHRLPVRTPFFYGWLIVGLAFVASILSGVTSQLFMSIMVKPMSDDLGWSRASYFFAVSLRGWIGIVVTPLMGGFEDKSHPLTEAKKRLLVRGTVIMGGVEKFTAHCRLTVVHALVHAGKVRATASAFQGALELGIRDLSGMEEFFKAEDFNTAFLERQAPNK